MKEKLLKNLLLHLSFLAVCVNANAAGGSNVIESTDIGDTFATAETIVFADNKYTISDEIGNGNYGNKDVDMFKLVVATGDIGRNFRFETSLPVGEGMTAIDTYIRLFDADGAEVDFNDDGSEGGYSLLIFVPTAAGTYYLGVSSYGSRNYDPNVAVSGDGGDTGNYTLTVTQLAAQEAASTVVTTELDVIDAYDGVISLREAIEHVGTNGLGMTITFHESMKGKTIVLDTGKYNYWEILKDMTIDAGGMDITVDAAGGKNDVYYYRVISNYATTTIIGLTATGLTREQSVLNCGGAFYNEGNLTLIDCQAVGNYTIGVNNRNVMTMINTVIVGNNNYGFYIDNIGTHNEGIYGVAYTTINNSTIVNDIGVNWSAQDPMLDLTINNSIINRLIINSSDYQAVRINHSLISEYNDYSNATGISIDQNSKIGSSLNKIDPKFVAYNPDATWTTDLWESCDLRLQDTSPAANAGNNSLIPSGITTDLDGEARIVNGTVDMGAYEYQGGSVGIEENTNTDADAIVVSSEYYSISGVRLPAKPQRGLYIVKKLMSNGSVVVEKAIDLE